MRLRSTINRDAAGDPVDRHIEPAPIEREAHATAGRCTVGKEPNAAGADPFQLLGGRIEADGNLRVDDRGISTLTYANRAVVQIDQHRDLAIVADGKGTSLPHRCRHHMCSRFQLQTGREPVEQRRCHDQHETQDRQNDDQFNERESWRSERSTSW